MRMISSQYVLYTKRRRNSWRINADWADPVRKGSDTQVDEPRTRTAENMLMALGDMHQFRATPEGNVLSPDQFRAGHWTGDTASEDTLGSISCCHQTFLFEKDFFVRAMCVFLETLPQTICGDG
jgi:hypothetical protein